MRRSRVRYPRIVQSRLLSSMTARRMIQPPECNAMHQAVQLLRTTNRGVSQARNAAIELLKAPYTLPLDADDRLVPGAVQHLLAAMNGKQDRLVYGRFQSWNTDMTKPLSQASLLRLRPNPFNYLSRPNFSPPGAILFPTSAFGRVGGFDHSLAVGEDWDFWIRLARIGLQFVGTKKVVFHYRRQPSSASNQPLRALTDGIEVIRTCSRTRPSRPRRSISDGFASKCFGAQGVCLRCHLFRACRHSGQRGGNGPSVQAHPHS